MLKPNQAEALQRIFEFESANLRDEPCLGWSWQDVRVHPSTLNALVLEAAIKVAFSSNSFTGYELTERGKEMQAVIGRALDVEQIVLPDDLFDPIVGHDDVKTLLRAALRASKPVHVLLLGPPALSKSLFLWEVERAYGERALWVLGSAASQAGLWDMIAERRPQVVLIDELDKLKGPVQAALLSLMEGGRLVRAKAGGRRMDLKLEAYVIAAANRTKGLSPELLSRFAVKDLHPYSRREFQEVVMGILISREGVEEAKAQEIATALEGLTQDVRDAIRIARLSETLHAKEAVELLNLQHPPHQEAESMVERSDEP